MHIDLKIEEDKIKNFNEYILGVDVGGTYTNLGITGIEKDKPILILSTSFKTNELTSLSIAILEIIGYIEKKYDINIRKAGIGAAGIVTDGKADLTHIPWNIDIDELIDSTGLSKIILLNDFQAIGYGVNLLEKKDIIEVKPGKHTPGHPNKAVIGAGTGLGKTILIYDRNKKLYYPIPSEGGHSDFPVQNREEIELIEFIQNKIRTDKNICYEELLSGRGLEYIYSFIRENKGLSETIYTKEIDENSEKASLISRYRKLDETCRETFRFFTKFYGRCIKNFILETMAIGGVYIAGGIAYKNMDIFQIKEFLDEIYNSIYREKILRDTPVYLIINKDISLLGISLAVLYKEE